jgi:hypothetical protein
MEQCMLVVTELAEAIEAYRNHEATSWTDANGKPQGIASEYADALIRLLHYSALMNINPRERIPAQDGLQRNSSLSSRRKTGMNFGDSLIYNANKTLAAAGTIPDRAKLVQQVSDLMKTAEMKLLLASFCDHCQEMSPVHALGFILMQGIVLGALAERGNNGQRS